MSRRDRVVRRSAVRHHEPAAPVRCGRETPPTASAHDVIGVALEGARLSCQHTNRDGESCEEKFESGKHVGASARTRRNCEAASRLLSTLISLVFALRLRDRVTRNLNVFINFEE